MLPAWFMASSLGGGSSVFQKAGPGSTGDFRDSRSLDCGDHPNLGINDKYDFANACQPCQKLVGSLFQMYFQFEWPPGL